MTEKIITRFAPSPTGMLHIGGARTALFNYLFARHHGGNYRLRIEDTDIKRSTSEAKKAIMDGLEWLNLIHDDAIVYQSENIDRHKQVALALLEKGFAYRCWSTPEELQEMREQAKGEGTRLGYNGYWRDKDPESAPKGIDPVIRFKMPQKGETSIQDLISGEVTIDNHQLDDLVLLRGDGTPTYMLSVVVDDHDMGVTHIIRGNDHMTNAFKQKLIFEAMDWTVPQFAHIPLIHGGDGAKLSKRHGALGVEAYQEMGYLPNAVCNYLSRLGWSHGDDEIFSMDRAIKWFSLENVGRSAARFDFAKLENLNAHYIREAKDEELIPLIKDKFDTDLNDQQLSILKNAMKGLKPRSKTIHELAINAQFYIKAPSFPFSDPKVIKFTSDAHRDIIQDMLSILEKASNWTHDGLENLLREQALKNEVGLGKLAQPLRAVLTGLPASPGLFEVMEVLGQDETLDRINSFLNSKESHP